MRKVRGVEIGMIFQNPSSHLDPVMRIGDQIAESVRYHEGASPRRRARAPSSCCARSAFPIRRAASTPIRTNSPAACASAR